MSDKEISQLLHPTQEASDTSISASSPSDVSASPAPGVSAFPASGVSASPLPRVSASPRLRVSVLVRKWLVRLSRFGLAALFLFTAGAKLAIARTFALNMGELLSASGFNYRWMWPATVFIIGLELIAASLLLVPRTVRGGALLTAALLLAFAGYALYYVYVLRGEPLECGCFGGILASQLGVKTALRNLALLLPAVIVFFGYKNEKRRLLM